MRRSHGCTSSGGGADVTFGGCVGGERCCCVWFAVAAVSDCECHLSEVIQIHSSPGRRCGCSCGALGALRRCCGSLLLLPLECCELPCCGCVELLFDGLLLFCFRLHV